MAARAAASPLAISPGERNWEVQVGREEYMKYLQQGEIVPRQSPLYGVLDPIANRIAAVADRQYYAPFRFILLNESEPNALAVPGGNVYVTTAMLSFLRNRDELAGVICHEVNHDIHHDMYDIYQIARYGAQPIASERAAEFHADRSGAYTCAKAGFNPWGMVWNLEMHREMGQQSPQTAATSDHPSDDQRLADLTALLTGDRATFGRFRDDIAAAAPLPNARVLAQSPYSATGNRGWYTTRYPSQYPMQYPAQYPSQYAPQYPSQYAPQYPSQYAPQYPSQYAPQYPSQYAPQYPSQYAPQYPMQYPAQYPMQYPSQYPSQYGQQNSSPPQMGPYPPPPLPACYPGC
jgi:beta-barrel assembly-enhancing protease